ncbi:MAG: cation-translocating P-type ATPase [Cyanobacteriota bacterium]|nr:cation-translocating P-type ATPase [Cyanobacteriota bacterium]
MVDESDPPKLSSPDPVGLLLDVEGMKCGSCVRSVEQRLLQQPGVRQASVNLLTRTAWVEVEGGQDQLTPLLDSLRSLGFEGKLRQDEDDRVLSRKERQRQQNWWEQWRQLLVALLLVLVSGLGHWAMAVPQAWPSALALFQAPWFHGLIATLALAGPGWPILRSGVRSSLAGHPGMDSLVGLGMGSAYLASAVGWLWPASQLPCFFNEPVMLLGFVLAGRFLEERARYRSCRAIEELASLQPDEALLLMQEGPPRPVRSGGLRPGDRILVLPGDRLPVDGIVQSGTSAVDRSALTGEPLPLQAAAGTELDAGSLNLEAPLVVEASRSGHESAIARIVHLVEMAQARKAPIQGLADRVAGGFTRFVLLLAAATFLFWWLWGPRLWPWVLESSPTGMGVPAGHMGHGLGGMAITPLGLAIQLAISVLVVACPCALGLATPTAISVGSALAARSGVLFRGGDAIETAAQLGAVVFDKTGTLTVGRPMVTSLEPFPQGSQVHGRAGLQALWLLQLAASLEQQSRHPLAHALLQEAQHRTLQLLPVVESSTHPGQGMVGRLEGLPDTIRVGRLSWLQEQSLEVPSAARGVVDSDRLRQATLIGVGEGDRLLGLIAVEDQPRPDARESLAALRQQGLLLGLLSGDREGSVRQLAAQVGLQEEELAWGLRPEQKVEALSRWRSHGSVAMVGDGINDAPALAAADLGIAVGTGTQIAQDSADVVVMGDRLSDIVKALHLARSTMAKVRQNLGWAFGYNLIVLPIAAGALLPRFGLQLTPPLAAFLMALSSITVVVNALGLQKSWRSIPLAPTHGQ